jgi:hypothetical protein
MNDSELPRLAAVMPMDGLALRIQWRDGRSDIISLTAWISGGGSLLAPIAEPETFKTAKVIDYGTSVQWADDDDLQIDAYHLMLMATGQ